MSLQLLAKQMEAKGRGGDSLLVHMTPEEVAGLQKLAESAGGSLSVNPETGLVEAFYLRQLLPAFVGLAAGAVGGPIAGAAAGAAVGGYQAKRNNQDVLMGAALGGLGGYGAGSLGAGLGAAGATSAGAAGATAAPMTAAQGLSQAGQGISALGTEVGSKAFMAKVGGGAGLLSDVSMAAAPLMAPGKKPGEAPVDDEMYYTEYNPGQTGERSSTSTEALQFAGGYTPIERIKDEDYMKRRNRQFSAAQGGLMQLAEGGETAAPTAAEVAAPTASEAALAYLMGERSSSAGLPAVRAPSTPASNIGVGGDGMYAFDPATGTFLRNPNVAGATSDAVRGPVGTSFASSGGGGGGSDNTPMSQQTKDFFDNESFLQREARMGEVNNLFSLGPVGAFANAITGSGLPGRAPDVGTLIGKSDLYNNLSDENMRSEGGRGGYDNSDDRGGYDPSGGDVGGEGGRGVDGTATGGMGPSSARAQGGLIGLAKGGMASGGFVVPADVVSALGNGSTDAGLRKLYAMLGKIKPIKGKGDGLSDSIPTNIDGKQAARVADGEAYIDPKTVKRLGGAKKLYAMMDKVRAQAHGKTTQQRKVNPARVMA